MAEPRDDDDVPIDPGRERALAIVRALRKHRARLAKKLEAVQGDLTDAERAPFLRRSAEALLVYLRKVPARAKHVSLPDPADTSRTLDIELDPRLNAQGNAARYFKRAAKAERALVEIPPRLVAIERELGALASRLHELNEALEREADPAAPLDDAALRAAAEALAALPPALRPDLEPAKPGPPERPSAAAVARGTQRAPSARLQPRRFKSAEGWDVLIGRNNEGNDYLTHQLARSEDYWFHVHGASGSHVVLRRGKGPNEPSKRTLEEVASWAAFYSQARTAGKVPVIWTLKKYVRKPRRSPPGLAVCEREKTVMVKPKEPRLEADNQAQ